jgi:SAM domain (Sterile alpha motif)
MQQISDWFGKLGMSEYAQRFAENGFNLATLPHLADQDLKDIGVLLGQRRIILAAISRPGHAVPYDCMRKPRLTEDEVARRKLGPRDVSGDEDSAKITPQQKRNIPKEGEFDGHVA